MYQQKLKKRVISILLILLVFCSAIAVTSRITASAESYQDRTTEPYSEQTVPDAETLSVPISIFSEDKAEYKNLGAFRRTEGYEVEDGKPLTNLHYIENANYFLANPQHRDNVKADNLLGTCTTVAMQMLVGYHNYYSDRRLLPKYSTNGKQLLADDYGNIYEHPTLMYYSSDDNGGLGRSSIGTWDGVYDRIFDNANGDGLFGQLLSRVTNATKKFLEEDSGLDSWTLENGSYDEDRVIFELESGRPVVVGFDLFEGHSGHIVVAYGYANYEGELCYITHYGWRDNKVQMLVPASWLGYQATMNVKHEHTFRDAFLNQGNYRALTCTTCGYTTWDLAYIPSLFGGGSGTVADPFLIKDANQFRSIGDAFRTVYVAGQGDENRIDYAFKLVNDINISGGWTPFSYKFTGDFNGAGKSITYSMNLYQADITLSEYQGLFGFVSNGGKIHDLILKDCKIESDTKKELSNSGKDIYIGIVAGTFYESSDLVNVEVRNPVIECKISGACIGAIAGSFLYTSAKQCKVTVESGKTSSITNNTRGIIGGMAGIADSVEQFRGCQVSIVLTNDDYSEGEDMMGYVIGNDENITADECRNTYGITTDVEIVGKDKCLAAGTLITLADGTQKPVEELTGDEILLVWNMYTGQYDAAPILFIDIDSTQKYNVINLTFSNGEKVKVISEHGFWDYDLNRYVYLDKDAAQYLGHRFISQTADEFGNAATELVQLVDVNIQTEETTAYSPVTYGHLCYFVNGMLSMPGGIEGLFNIFEVDKNTMRYDEASMQEDIEQYGLFTYEEFAELVPVSREVFEAFNGQYLKVAIGKGLIDVDTLNALASRYAKFFVGL